jgi:SSS family solute:Na+ symporter
MKAIDWAVLVGTLAAIVGYGSWRERGAKTTEVYLRGGRDLRWWTIGLSIMATQASAITFLSMPGQAFEDGMGFIQFYLGLPIAMVVLSAFILPLYYRLRVYTAYEYLEGRFDRKTRQLTALLFLVSRGLGAGISIFAPAIVLSTVLGWSVQLTNLIIGGATIAYTVSGGARTVSRTQTYQMVVMLGGMALAAAFIVGQLPHGLSLDHTLRLAGTLGKMQIIDYAWRFDKRYTFWTGMSGGLFVALAYFGTDQSQVQRYLGGASLTESRLGLVFNGLVKLPMQLMILFVGVLLFVFYLFQQPPLFFDGGLWRRAHDGPSAAAARTLDTEWDAAFAARRQRAAEYVTALDKSDGAARDAAAGRLRESAAAADGVRAKAKTLVARNPTLARAAGKDNDYIFIGYVIDHFPPGLVGLLIAVIVCAAMSATASALSSLGSTSVVDFYRPWRPQLADGEYVRAARWFTVLWGGLAVAFAAFAAQLDNLIQAVNILGSIFYGQMLGVFLCGFFLKWVRATPVFIATLVAQAVVIFLFLRTNISFLYYNVIGCAVLVGLALLLDVAMPRRRGAPAERGAA